MRRQKKAEKGQSKKERHKFFCIMIHLLDTNEKFTLKKIYNDMTIRQLKEYAEFVTGIPYNLQRLTYLDEGEFQSRKTIYSETLIPFHSSSK